MNLYQVLIAPIVTEKTEEIKNALPGTERYSFYVHRDANKELIRKAIKMLYKVSAVKINVMTIRGKYKRFQRERYRKPSYKKAIVTLSRGENIELLSKEK